MGGVQGAVAALDLIGAVMARDYKAIEAEFIADLKARSGRDLAEWMAAIDALGHAERDVIIKWLQPQGFTFEHASWLERIHNNAGVPIYQEALSPRRMEPQRPPAAPAPSLPVSRPAAPAGVPIASDPDAVGAVLARGKAFRMLAELLIGEARRVLPGLAIGVRDDLVCFDRPATLAVLAVSPRELRLGLALRDRPLQPPLHRPKGIGADPTITHMAVLNDARQVDEALLELLRLADRNVNSTSPNH